MDQFGEDPLTKLAFTIQANKGVYALLLGSGISLSSGIKTGWGITCDLIARYAVGCDEKEPDFEDDQGRDQYWAAWYVDKYKKQPDYSDLLEKLGNTEAERQSIIKVYIEPSSEDNAQGKKAPTKAHHAIAKLVKDGFIKVIITTNFDRLLEQALHHVGITTTVINSQDDLLGQDPLDHSHCYLIKVHGDYKDHRIKNTIGELSKYPNKYKALLKRIFNDYGLIVCGWSAAWDIALKNTIRSASNRRYSLFWASYGELGEDAAQIVEERKGNVIPTNKNKIGGADGFFTKLQEKVEQIEKLSLRRPRTEALILSTLKDYLSEPEKNRNRIDDLFKEVLTTQLLEFPEFHKPEWVHRSWEEKFTICENQTQTLAKMVGILGIYGKGREKEVELVCNCIQMICNHLRNKQLRVQYYSNDKSNLIYPAYLLFNIYGIILTKEQRWKNLHDLLNFPLKNMWIETLEGGLQQSEQPMWWFFAGSRFENICHFPRLSTNQKEQIHQLGNTTITCCGVEKEFSKNQLIQKWIKDITPFDTELDFIINKFYFLVLLVSIECPDLEEFTPTYIAALKSQDDILMLRNSRIKINYFTYSNYIFQAHQAMSLKYINEINQHFFANIAFKEILINNGYYILIYAPLLTHLFDQLKQHIKKYDNDNLYQD